MLDLWSWERSRDDARIAGVCGALAARTGLDPLLVRLGAVFAALSGGIGLVVYGFAWAWLRREGETEAPIHRLIPASKRWSHTAVLIGLAVTCVAAMALLGGSAPFGVMPLIIMGVVFWVYRRPPGRGRTSRPPAADSAAQHPAAPQQPETPFLQAARDWQQRVQQAQHEPGTAAPEPAPRTPVPPPTTAVKAYLAEPDPVGLYSPLPEPRPTAVVERPRGRRIWWLALALVGAFSASLAIAAAAGVAVSAAAYAAGVALALGLCLVLGAWVGRPRWLIASTVVALVVAMAAAAPSVPTPPIGNDQSLHYTRATEIPTEIKQESGQVVLDLSDLTVDENRTVNVSLDAGSVVVRLPDDPAQKVAVQATSEFGWITMDGRDHHGADLNVAESFGTGARALTLSIHTEAGLIEVQR